MMKIRQHIPNLLSLTNALFGGIGTYLTITDSVVYGIVCMGICVIADFLDGFMARKLNAYSPLGKDLDSLADAISFGVAPATMMAIALGEVDFIFPALAFLIVPASVYRLAKFNHDERQTTSFIGLPTPANALFWAGVSYWITTHTDLIAGLPTMLAYKLYALWPILIVLMSWLLVSEIPMFSLKSGGPSRKTPLYIVLTTALVTLPFMGISALAPTLGVYVLYNIIAYFRTSSKERKG